MFTGLNIKSVVKIVTDAEVQWVTSANLFSNRLISSLTL
jgi:hypothetical protein